jgi:hypothetical protein
MQKFDYRAPRFAVDIPVRIVVDGSTHGGRCKNISIEGMKVELREPLAVDARGLLSMDLDGQILEIGVQITYSRSVRHGVRFLCESEDQREILNRYMAFLAAPQNRPGLIVVR